MADASPHLQFVHKVEQVVTNAVAVAEHLHGLTDSLQQILQTSPEATDVLLRTAASLAHRVSTSTANYRDCLLDLVTMGEAMTPIMESNPEAAPSLMVNLYSTFFRQTKAYYHDMDDSFWNSSRNFEEGRSAFYKENTTATHAGSDSRSASMTVSPAPLATQTTTPDGPAIPSKSKKQRRHSLADELTHHCDGDKAVPQVLATPTKGSPGLNSPEHNSDRAEKGRMTSATAARTKSGKADQQIPPYMPPANEPTYLRVVKTVEEAQGRLISASRPSVFNPVEIAMQRQQLKSYYVRLPRPGSLAYLVVKTYINVSEDVQTDLLCDVLETDCVEVEPMSTPAGEVIVKNELDLSEMPTCAWRVGNNEDHSRIFFTMYTIVKQLPSVAAPSAIIQDALMSTDNNVLQEILHVVTLVTEAPGYAKVTAYGVASQSQKDKTRNIVDLTHATLSQMGFSEAQESEVLASFPAKDNADSQLRPDRRAATDVIGTFQPPVQLASLDNPQQMEHSNSKTFGDVARGVLWAPLTVGRVVGGAVLDVTGVTEAVRNSIESNFRKSFPKLESETIVDSYSAAWQEGSILKQGYLYITTHWLCFVSTLAAAKFSIEYDEIKDIKKMKSAKLFDNAIEVKTHLGDCYFLSGLLQRDNTFQLLMKQWLTK